MAESERWWSAAAPLEGSTTPPLSSTAARAEEDSAAGGSPQQRRRRAPIGRAPVSLVLALAWAVLGVLFVWGAGMLPGAAAQPDDDEGAPFPISTTSKGIGRRRRAGTVKPQHVLMASINELAHIKPLTALGKELVRRGHRVTFVAPESCLLGLSASACLVDTKGWLASQLPQATFVSAGPALTAAEREAAAPPDLARAVLYALQTVSDVNEAILETLLREFAGKDKQSSGQPDMVVADFLTTAAVDAAEALGLPLVVNNPFPICHDLTEPQGILVPVHAFPAPLLSLETFKGRVANLINHFLWLCVGLHAARLRNRMRRRHGLPVLPVLDQLSFRASPAEARAWILQNTVFGLEVPRAVDPRTHMLGPLLTPPGAAAAAAMGAGDGGCPTRGQPGAKECGAVMKWLNQRDRKERGVIYVTLAEASMAPAPMLMVHAVMKALAADQISQHFDVLWVLDAGSTSRLERTVPKHMLAVPAAPHLEVLRHPRVRAVLSQSSLDAVSEALWHGLPLVGLPLRGYDRGACTLAQDAGAARCLLPAGKKAWTHPEVTVAAALEVAGPVPPTTASISSFRAQARRLSAIMQAAGGVPRAADLVELAARVGLAHLQQPRLKMGLGMGSTWLSGSMVDVRLTLFLLLLLSYWALTLAARLARRLVRWAKWYWSAAAKHQQQQQQEGEGGEGKANGGNGLQQLQGPAPSPSYQPSPRSSRPGSLSGTPQPPTLHASASAPGGLDRHPSSPLSPGYQATVRTNGSSGGSSRSGFGERPPLPPGAGRDR